MLKMFFSFVCLVFVLIVLGCGHPNDIVDRDIVGDLEASTAKITITAKNGKKNTCTAFAYKRRGYLYRFITAAHCVSDDDEEWEKVKIFADKIDIVLENKKRKTKLSYSAKLIATGYQEMGDDFAILEAELDEHIPILPLSRNRPGRKECILSAGAPSDYVSNFFYGYVHKVDYNKGSKFVVRMLSGEVPGGTSGSAVVSCFEGKIIAVVVASTRKDPRQTVVIPIARFLKFEKMVMRGNYMFSSNK